MTIFKLELDKDFPPLMQRVNKRSQAYYTLGACLAAGRR
jgi:hypothetical protein